MRTDEGRKLYSIPETYRFFYDAMRTVRYMSVSRKNNELSLEFMERIMLAVTQVNACPICSYAHTKMALEAGMSSEEIQKLLSGVIDDTPPCEAAAVIFAQHYADSRGKPSKASWERIEAEYGPSEAKGILGAIRIITLANTYGIPFSSFLNRFKGRPDQRSNLFYEISMFITGLITLPIVLIHVLVSALFKIPVIRFLVA
ncbi:MAG: carboxymuconolactone decarboxylase family protein [Eubacteriales bacterium]